MEKEFVPYEQALELKLLGFNEPCMKGYTEEYKKLISFSSTYTNTSVEKTLPTKPLTAPLYQQAFRWFREKFYLHSCISAINNGVELLYAPMIDIIDKKHKAILNFDDYKTYEEAELECLKKLIEIVKNK
jgi:hypothetical protein